jgi:alkanesulfonate monooxygenase SsuD/methylene tetrahydromethanopterin reductase-like flavin-dependent oxidoreductase (luciferase family)
VAHKLAVLKQHCETLGRDYNSIHCTMGTFCSIADSDEEAQALVPDAVKSNLSNTSLVGSPATIRQRINSLEALGIHEVIINFPHATDLTPLHRFAQEFIA